MIKIGVDYRLANTSSRGMARYCREMIAHLIRLDKENLYYLYIDAELKDLGLEVNENVVIRKLFLSNYILTEQLLLPYCCWKDKLNLFWSPCNTFPLYKLSKYKLVVTIHDLIFFHTSFFNASYKQRIGALYRKYCLKLGSSKIDGCATVSEFSRKSIEDTLGIHNIRITYNCIDSFYEKVKQRKFDICRSDFYFTVSGDAPSKNLSFILDYFSTRLDKYLVVAGVPNQAKIRLRKFSNIAFLPEGVPDEVLIDNYLSCRAFLFLSLQEGFGLPLLEALVCGCRIIASDRTSIPEILADNGLLIDPTNVSELEAAFLQIDTFYVDYQARIKCMDKFLYWKTSAKNLLDCFNNLC